MPAAEVDDGLLAHVEQLAFRWGEAYDSYLVSEAGRDYFFTQDRRGVVGCRRRGRHVHVVGGLIAPEADREALLRDFLAFIGDQKWTATFHSVPRSQIDFFRKQGMQITKSGEEPIVQLDKTQWRGKEYEWLRRQENFCKRQGVAFTEVEVAPADPAYQELGKELAEVSQKHLEATFHVREMEYFVGHFDPLTLGRRRLFVARHEGKVLAFVVCNPCHEGKMWAVEMYRRLPGSIKGVMPYAILQVLRKLQDEGIAYASLSLVPCLRCELVLPGDSLIFRSLCYFWWRRMNWLFDVQGIYHFKSRFRPHFREMYIAAYPRTGYLSTLTFGMIWGVMRVSPRRVLQTWWRSLIGKRKKLAKPSRRPERVMRAPRIKKSQDSET